VPYLRDVEGLDSRLCDLVAYHTGAIHEAQQRGFESALLREFDVPPEPLAEALVYCDITTGPNGDQVDVHQRLADIQERYGAGHPVSRALGKAKASFVESVKKVEARLSA
jgi:hypothetical protein